MRKTTAAASTATAANVIQNPELDIRGFPSLLRRGRMVHGGSGRLGGGRGTGGRSDDGFDEPHGERPRERGDLALEVRRLALAVETFLVDLLTQIVVRRAQLIVSFRDHIDRRRQTLETGADDDGYAERQHER